MAEVKPDPQAGEPPVVDERPDWLPDNFADEAAFRRSYDEAQRKITELGQENARLRDEYVPRDDFEALAALVEQQSPQPPAQQFGQPDPFGQNPLLYAQQRALEDGDFATYQALNLQLQDALVSARVQEALKSQPQTPAQQPASPEANLDLLAAFADQQLRQQYGDAYEQSADKAAELIRSGQVTINEPSLNGVQSAMETAFKLANYANLAQAQQAAQAEEARREETRRAKSAAQTVQGSGGRPPDPDAAQQVWDELMAAGQNRFRTS